MQIGPTILIRQALPPAVPPASARLPKPPYPQFSFHTFTRSTSIATDDHITAYLSIYAISLSIIAGMTRQLISPLAFCKPADRMGQAHTEIAVLLDFSMRKLHNIAVPTVGDSVPGICPLLFSCFIRVHFHHVCTREMSQIILHHRKTSHGYRTSL